MADYRDKLTPNLRKALDTAMILTLDKGIEYVGSEHLIYAFLSLEGCAAYSLLQTEKIHLDEYAEVFYKGLTPSYTAKGLTPNTKEMVSKAVELAESIESGSRAGTAHFLFVALSANCVAVRYLERLGADIDALKRKAKSRIFEDIAKKESGYEGEGSGSSTYHSEMKTTDISDTGIGLKEYNYLSPASKKRVKLEKDGKEKTLPYGIDLTEKAKKGKIDPVIGRKKEIEKVVQVLSRRSKNSPVLVGEPGVGKSAIAEGLALLIADGDVPEQLYNKTVFSVDIPAMLAGAKYRGDFEERLKDLTDTVMEDGDVVLFIDEIHTIVGAGSSSDNSMDAANILKPMLARGDIQVIGATTIEEYRKYIEKDSALERRFTPVYVEEPTEAAAIEILKGLRSKYEEHHGVLISDDAIKAAVQLSSRYITDRFLPDKAIDLIDEAAARARIVDSDGGEEMETLKKELAESEAKRRIYESHGEYAEATDAIKEKKRLEERIDAVRRANRMERCADGRSILGKEQVAAIVSGRTNIPLLKISQEEGEKLMRLEEDLHARIIGQNEAVEAVSKSIRRARAGLKDPSRPIGSFIFVGPTGVGKTDLCKALAEALFGSEEQMIRLDMSEYMERQSISKLIGAAPGYVGYDDAQTGQLTDKVRTHPYSVILFDEIEKAHPDVFNLLLQILDDGRLTDNKGKTVNFKNTVIILTSNIGAEKADVKDTGIYGFGGALQGTSSGTDEKAYEEMKEKITDALKEHFRPEFLNRLDDIIVFRKLTKEDAEQIGGKIVDGLSKRLLEQRGIILTVSSAALSRLVEEGYDSRYGARPLKREIQKRIEDKLSGEILVGNIRNGEKICVGFNGKDFIFTKE